MAKTPSGKPAATRTKGANIRHRMLAAASVIGVATVATLGSAGGSYALWSATATVDAGVLTSGSISGSMTVSPSQTVPLTTDVSRQAFLITVSNGGTVSGDFTTTATVASGSSALANAITLEIWQTTSPETCTTQPAPSTALVGTWASPPTLTGTLAAASSASFCALTTLGNTASIPDGSAVNISFETVLTRSGWSSSAKAALTQSFKDDKAPVAPTGLAATAITETSATISWAATNDNVAVTRYDLHRNGTWLGSVDGSTLSMVDSSLIPGTTYAYTATARDAANNVSVESTPPLSFTTLKAAPVDPPTGPPTTVIDSSTWYQIGAGDGKCLDTNSSKKLQKKDCVYPAPDAQRWQFQGPNAAGYYRAVSATSSAWAESSKADEVALQAATTTTPYQWQFSGGVNGAFRFTFANGLCLQHPGNANIALAGCPTSPQDAFTFVVTSAGKVAQRMVAPLVAVPAPVAPENSSPITPETLPAVELSSSTPDPSLPVPMIDSSTAPLPNAPAAPATAPVEPAPTPPPATPAPAPAPIVVPSTPALPVEQVPSPESVRKTNEASQEPLTPPTPAATDAAAPTEGESA